MHNICSSEGLHKIKDNICDIEVFRKNNQTFIDELLKWGADNDADVSFIIDHDGSCYCKHRFIEYEISKLRALENNLDAMIRCQYPNAESCSIIAPVIIGSSLAAVI